MRVLNAVKLCLATLAILPMVFSSTVLAVSQDQINILKSGIYFFNLEESTNACGSGTTLVGSNYGEQIFNYLTTHGLSPIQAAGFMGNLQVESGLNPARVQNTRTPQGDSDTMKIDGLTGYGLAQWTSIDRQKNLHAAAVAAGAKDSNIGVQLDYLWSELTGGYKSSTYTPLLATNDIRQATSIVMLHFESPADQSLSAQKARGDLSIGILAKYGSGANTTPTTGPPAADAIISGCTDNSGAANQINGAYALPLDKSFYDQHKVWFTKPHHGYPASDIPVPTGTKVYSITDGKVLKAPVGGTCGIGVLIEASPGTIFLYCHGSDGGSVPGAKQGDTVKAGQLIMHSASTGQSTGPHLHVQLDIKDIKHCPQNLFVAIAENQTIPDLNSLPTSGCTY